MNKLVLICLLFVIPAAIAQTTCDNPLLTKLGVTTKLSTSAVQTGLQFCKSLEGLSLCCPTATINNLQNTVNLWVADILVKAATRDTWLLFLRSDPTVGLPSFQTALATLQTNAVAASNLMTAATTGSNALTGADLTRVQNLQAAVLPYTTISTQVTANADSKWESYEQTRATCIDALIEAQASIYCVSCRGDYNSQGIDNSATASPAITLTSGFQTAISGSCQPFLVQAQIQNSLVTAYAYRATLATLSGKLAAVTDTTLRAANNPDSTTTIFAGFTPATITKDAQEPLAPLTTTNCASSTACTFVYTTLLQDGAVLNKDYAAVGGAITVSDSRRVLPETESRTLSVGAGSLNPSSVSSGVVVAFPDDAIAAVNSGFRQGGLMTCFVALIAAFLF